MAATTLPLIFSAFSMNSARRLRTTSSTPPSSPAFTMLMKRRLKTLGCCAKPSEKVEPPSMERERSPKIFLRTGLRSCFSSTRKPRNNGRPASTSVANWRVKVQSTLAFTLPPNPGILMLIWPPPFLAPLPPAAPLAPLPPLASDLGAAASVTLVGRKPISLRRLSASAWLPTSRTPLVSLPVLSMAT